MIFFSFFLKDKLESLRLKTGLSKKKILHYYAMFMKMCKYGLMDHSQFISFHRKMWPNGNPNEYCENAFKVFDLDENGVIDFEEFLLLLTIYGEGSFSTISHEMLFKLYDHNSDNSITKHEMIKTLQCFYDLTGVEDKRKRQRIPIEVDFVFKKLNKSDTSAINLRDFLQGLYEEPRISLFLSLSQNFFLSY